MAITAKAGRWKLFHHSQLTMLLLSIGFRNRKVEGVQAVEKVSARRASDNPPTPLFFGSHFGARAARVAQERGIR